MDYLKPSEAAKLLNVSYFTLKQWIYEGKIQSIKTPGGHHRIPRSEIDLLTGGARQEGEQSGWPPPKPGREGHRILVVEDAPGTSEVLAGRLKGWGYEPTMVNSAMDALAHLEAGASFDLYLLDYMLPDIAGTDLCRLIRERDPLTPVIFFSEYASDVIRKATLGAGAKDLIPKLTSAFQQQENDPFSMLKAKVDWWIQNPEAEHEEGAAGQT